MNFFQILTILFIYDKLKSKLISPVIMRAQERKTTFQFKKKLKFH